MSLLGRVRALAPWVSLYRRERERLELGRVWVESIKCEGQELLVGGPPGLNGCVFGPEVFEMEMSSPRLEPGQKLELTLRVDTPCRVDHLALMQTERGTMPLPLA